MTSVSGDGGEADRDLILVDYQDGVSVITLVGEHDLATSPGLEKTLETEVARGGGVVLSLAEADFIDSSTIRVVFLADTKLQDQQRRLVVHVGTPHVVERAIELSGMLDEMPWTEDLNDAVALARSTT
jgi:anti-anti-sigma factor